MRGGEIRDDRGGSVATIIWNRNDDDSQGAPGVVGLVGRSGSGKTSLLESLIPALTARGLAVGAVKHTSHGFAADRPGKDSYRLYESGAEAVALISQQQIACFTRRDFERDAGPRLAAVLAALPHGLDLVLAEGFSWEAIPRFVLVPESEDPLPNHFEHGEVLGIVHVPRAREGQKPAFPRDLVDSLADALARHAGEQRRNGTCRPATSLPPALNRSWIRTGPPGGPPPSSG
jgi:molybdopterin-guanine dinucleotide biosynthesis protein B